jgi:UDP-N-acetylglucosamine--N-acetylmuramyl-(pentapeptide) pyrophosphoryl-undecaprenol N-acetylglucosamine transferase
VRHEIRERSREAARAALGVPADAFCVLALGGSRGAGGLNRALAAALPSLGALPAGARVLWLCGVADLDGLRAPASSAPVAVDLRAWLDDMPAALKAADVAVCRAGASTLAELAAAGLASILVPFPHAADDHQTRNAGTLAAAGAADVLPEAGLTGAALGGAVAALAADGPRRAAMGRAAAALDRPDAAVRIAREILAAMGRGASC